MAVPDAIAAQLSALNVAVKAAGDPSKLSFTDANALAYQAGSLANAIENAMPGAAGALDTFSTPLMPDDITTGVLGLLSAAQTQSSLADLEGFVARIEINLENR